MLSTLPDTRKAMAAAVTAAVAVALTGEDSLRDDFMRLAAQQEFPAMADSALVLQVREGLDSALSRALCELIQTAFGVVGQAA
jgi:hypothetical protein